MVNTIILHTKNAHHLRLATGGQRVLLDISEFVVTWPKI